MKSFVVAAALVCVAGMALAEPSCSAPKDKWMPEATFKVNKGQCYEIYGKKDGKHVEHWFDPATGARVTK